MAKAHITTKSGAQVIIEGDAAEVAKIVSQIDQPPHVSAPKEADTTPRHKEAKQKKAPTISDLVINLKREGFFDKPKSLGEIGAELEKSGYLYPATTLSGIVLSLLKKKELTRTQKDGKWVYGKR
ncbi:MAG TPA: hypothetical protein VJT54_05825 [Verrucomicrobiae bacterium]|nr:hypothetical protein [Verrucomicrobiae bacterium]